MLRDRLLEIDAGINLGPGSALPRSREAGCGGSGSDQRVRRGGTHSLEIAHLVSDGQTAEVDA